LIERSRRVELQDHDRPFGFGLRELLLHVAEQRPVDRALDLDDLDDRGGYRLGHRDARHEPRDQGDGQQEREEGAAHEVTHRTRAPEYPEPIS
jgi:hypothetical protein